MCQRSPPTLVKSGRNTACLLDRARRPLVHVLERHDSDPAQGARSDRFVAAFEATDAPTGKIAVHEACHHWNVQQQRSRAVARLRGGIRAVHLAELLDAGASSDAGDAGDG